MTELENLLKSRVTQVNNSAEKLRKAGEWVNGYRGKIVQLLAGGQSFHLVFTREGVGLRRGEYPSCEITYCGEEEVVRKILQGQAAAAAEVKGGRLVIWGSMHESSSFEELMRAQ